MIFLLYKKISKWVLFKFKNVWAKNSGIGAK